MKDITEKEKENSLLLAIKVILETIRILTLPGLWILIRFKEIRHLVVDKVDFRIIESIKNYNANRIIHFFLIGIII